MNRETIMQALFAKLNSAPLVFDFIANIEHGSPVLQNVSDDSGLFEGLPVSGDGIQTDAVLISINPPTMSLPAKKSANQITVRQGFINTGRRLVAWEECEEQPAMFLCAGDEIHPDRPPSAAAKIEIAAEVYIYTKAGEDPDAIPEAALNRFIDALEKALDPKPTSPTGMWGGLGLRGVIYCRIQGDLVKATGDNGAQAAAVIPIRILVAQGQTTRPTAG